MGAMISESRLRLYVTAGTGFCSAVVSMIGSSNVR
jgi:hypothetical protein